MIGALWILGSALFGSCMSAMAKFLGAHFDAVEVAFFRALVGLALTLPVVLRMGRAGWAARQPLVQVFRGVLAGAVMLCGFYAVAHIPLADFTVIAFTRALFVVALAAAVLGEKIHGRRTIATIIGFMGVLIIIRPGGAVGGATLVALLGAALAAVAIMLVKLAARTDSPVSLLLYSNLVQTVMLAGPAAYYWVTPDFNQLLALVGVGILGTLAQFCIVRGYSMAEASAVVPFDYARLLFAAVLGYLFFSDIPDAWTWAGAAVIVGSTFYIARREARLGKRGVHEPSVERGA